MGMVGDVLGVGFGLIEKDVENLVIEVREGCEERRMPSAVIYI